MNAPLEDVLVAMSDADRAFLAWQARWLATARPQQIPPEDGWTEFGALAGRGFGKTRVGAEWLGRVAYEDPEALPRCVVAPTQADVRFTCFEGESGLLNVIPPECVAKYNASDLILTLANGATIRGFSAEKADRLRGPQHADAWCMPPYTPVLMADLSLKSLGDIRAGEYVQTRFGPKRVVAAGASGNTSPQVRVQAVSDEDGDVIVLRCTDDHPILVDGKWTAPRDIKPGARLTVAVHDGGAAAGPYEGATTLRWVGATVERVQYDSKQWPKWVPHCLSVEHVNEFVAGGVVVHNCDELAAWGKDAIDTWDMLQFGMRLGPKPRVLWTTTPKPVEIVRKLTAPQAERLIVRGSTYDNKANLPKSFFKALEQYEGTRIGRQELDGELLDPEEAGIIKRSWFRLWPAKTPLPKFDWIIMSLDTAYTEHSLDKKGDPDPSACGVFGVFHHEKRSNIMLLDCWDEHLGLPELIRKVRREMNTPYGDDEDAALIKPMFGSAKPLTSGRKPDILLIEDKGSGISLRQMLAEHGLEAYAYNPGRADKLSRLHVVSPILSQRRVWLPESDKYPGKPRTWCEPLVAQLCTFAGDGSIKHDDYVDVTTQAIRLCVDKGLISMLPPPPAKVTAPRDRGNPYAQ